MAGEILAGLAALKAAIDAALAINTIKNDTERQLAVSAVVAKLAAVQNDYAALSEKVQELRDENRRLTDWGREKKKYEMASPGMGAIAYRLQAANRRSEPPHYICEKCYEDGQKSILQARQAPLRTTELVCNRCKAVITVFGNSVPAW